MQDSVKGNPQVDSMQGWTLSHLKLIIFKTKNNMLIQLSQSLALSFLSHPPENRAWVR